MKLQRHGSVVGSVFDLAGRRENDLTSALGFALTHCDAFLEVFLCHVWPTTPASVASQVSISLEVRGVGGRTDLEIVFPTGEVLIIEAKRDWLLPGETQLRGYAPRITRGGALVSLSQASKELAASRLPSSVDGIPVIHLPWSDVLDQLAKVRHRVRGADRLWLEEFHTYLHEVIKVRSIQDSWTYCVVASHARPTGGGSRTFREYVTQESNYFHPYGASGWPTTPPNFMAFRWAGAVQRIHRVVHATVVPALTDRWPDIEPTEENNRPFAVYELGPRLPPHNPIPSGAQYRASRMWVLLDQLQTADSLHAAMASSKALDQAGSTAGVAQDKSQV